MKEGSELIGTGTLTIPNDPRILKTGFFLRKTKLNELPQLINIFKGDMSVVGPRPMVKEGIELYDKNIRKSILSVKPGLSGIGSLIFRDEESFLKDISSPNDFYKTMIIPYKGKVEEWFVLNAGVKNYFLIIFLTIVKLILPNSNIFIKVFNDLPSPDEPLKSYLEKAS
tara:strand:- start:504 stop:1010 length:507 start_codon:yes stop_codon:yes gene_type:complete